jgi:long-chain acyl-CoA synthetase
MGEQGRNQSSHLGSLVYVHGQVPLHEVLGKHARTKPSDVAMIWYGREISFRELNEWVDLFAAVLQSLNVKSGDRVALFLHNCPQYVIAHYAIQKIGAVVGPCSAMFKKLELEYQVRDMGAKVIVTSDVLYPIAAEVQPVAGLEHVVVTHYGELLPNAPTIPVPAELLVERQPTPNAVDMFGAMATVQVPTRPAQVDLDDVALLVYTSGTTGRPKGAMLTYRNALFKTAATVQANGMLKDERILAVMPMFHIAGMLMGLNIPIYTGCPVLLLYKFDPEAVLAAIHHHRCSWWYSTAPMNVALMRTPNAETWDLSSLRRNVCTSFGIPLTRELAEQWNAFTKGCPVYEAAYGLSETHTADTFMPAHAVKWGTHGLPNYETEIRIVDPATGEDLPVGMHGEIVIRNPGVFRGYWRNREATDRTLRDGWVYTGDIGFLDEDGYLTFVGRMKEMIKVSGFSVFPEDVEALFIQHPDVAQVAVVGIPDEQRGEVVKAYIVLKPDRIHSVGESELLDWAKVHMAPYKVPRTIEFRDALPMSGTGKVLRRLLQEPTAGA